MDEFFDYAKSGKLIHPDDAYMKHVNIDDDNDDDNDDDVKYKLSVYLSRAIIV